MLKRQTPQTMKAFYSSVTKMFFFGLLLIVSVQSSIAQCKLIINQDFNHWNDRRYSIADVKSDFNNKVKPWTASTYRGIAAPGAAASLIGNVAQETRIVNGELRAEYTKNDAGGYAGGFLFDPYFDGVEEAYLQYKVKFDDNFFWATGGKLPGLGGSTSGINSETTGRGTVPSGCKYNTNGWSARLMWRRNRAQTDNPYLILYSYFAEKANGGSRVDGDCGDGKRIFTGLKDDTWYTVRQYIKMNTPGQKDGVVVMWINGIETYRDTKAMIRNAGKGNLKINALIMNTYRGGSRTDPVWHSPRDEYAFFDDFVVWTGCSEPPFLGSNLPPTGSFVEPTINTVQEGYSDLYVLVDASDPNGDPISLKLTIDGQDNRGSSESNPPYEWGHATSPIPDETLNLTPGDHLFEVTITDSKGASTTITKTITVVEQRSPFSGVPLAIPGVLQTENYDKGGQGVAYFDSSPGNSGEAYRTDQVDIDLGASGHVVGWTSSGEWLEYTIDVAKSASYDFKFNTSSLNGGGSLDVLIDGNELMSEISIPQTGDWDSYSEFIEFADLAAGEHILRVDIVQSGFNIDQIEITESSVTGFKSSMNDGLSVYPNPSSSGQFHVNQAARWNVMNAVGVIVKSGDGELVDLSENEKGLYFLQVEDKIVQLINE